VILFCACHVEADSLPKGASGEDKRLKQVVAENLTALLEFGVAYSIVAIILRSGRSEMQFDSGGESLHLISVFSQCPRHGWPT
jgi:hypothetical protein